jgi:hypothetical protein
VIHMLYSILTLHCIVLSTLRVAFNYLYVATPAAKCCAKINVQEIFRNTTISKNNITFCANL